MRRRSPSPRRPTYDSYVPHTAPLYRDDYPNVYRPNRRYYSRSPSPGRYERPRPESRHWEPGARRPSSYYPDRRSTPGSPRDNPRRDTMAERMFESSDFWKHPHGDRSARYEPYVDPSKVRSLSNSIFSSPDTPSDRYMDRRPYFSRDSPPHRFPPRTEFPPNFTGDCYRPLSSGQPSRETYSFPRTADTYRPNYDDDLRRHSYSTDSLASSSHRGRRDFDSSSIASTPPRQHLRSPTPHRQYAQPPSVDGNKRKTPDTPPPHSPHQSAFKQCMTPPPDFYRHQSPILSSQLPEEQPLHNAHILYPQRSPTSGEPPRKKLKCQSPSPPRVSEQAPLTISISKQGLPTSLQFSAEPLSSAVHNQNIPQESQGVPIDPSPSQLVNHETAHVTNGLSGRETNLELHLPPLVAPASTSDDHSTPAQGTCLSTLKWRSWVAMLMIC